MTETDKIQIIFKLVCDFRGIPIEKAYSKTRKREIVECRQIAMTISMELIKATLQEIGQNIGGKDHATVLHAKKTIKNLCDTNKKFKHDYESIKHEVVKHFNLYKIYNVITPFTHYIIPIDRSARIRNKLKIYAKQGI